MKFITNLKISKKLFLLTVVFVASILIQALFGSIIVNNLAKSPEDMKNVRVARIQFLSNIMQDLGKMQSLYLALAITTDKDKTAALVSEYNKISSDADKKLNEYMAMKKNPAIQQAAETMMTHYTTWLDTGTHFKEQAVNSDLDAMRSGWMELRPLYFELRENLSNLMDLNVKAMDESIDHAHSLIRMQEVVMVALFIISVITSVILSFAASGPITKLLAVVVSDLKELAKGNLTIERIETDAKDETGELAKSLNETAENLRELIGTVAKSSEEISAGSEEMSAAAEQTAEGAQHTAASTQQLAQGSQQISQQVELGAKNVGELNGMLNKMNSEATLISKLGNKTEDVANEGKEHVENAVNKIGVIKEVAMSTSNTVAELGELSKEIEQIVDLIKGIASQTNLLALNAAIEAARAGEHGKGFAVVAEEVKKLATESSDATDKITEMIKEIQSKTNTAVMTMNKATNEVDEGVTVVNDAGLALTGIINSVKEINQKIEGMSKEIYNVSQNSEDLVKMMESISAVTEESSASSEEISSITEEQTASLQEISASSRTLATVAERLNGQVSVFKL